MSSRMRFLEEYRKKQEKYGIDQNVFNLLAGVEEDDSPVRYGSGWSEKERKELRRLTSTTKKHSRARRHALKKLFQGEESKEFLKNYNTLLSELNESEPVRNAPGRRPDTQFSSKLSEWQNKKRQLEFKKERSLNSLRQLGYTNIDSSNVIEGGTAAGYAAGVGAGVGAVGGAALVAAGGTVLPATATTVGAGAAAGAAVGGVAALPAVAVLGIAALIKHGRRKAARDNRQTAMAISTGLTVASNTRGQTDSGALLSRGGAMRHARGAARDSQAK